MASVGEGGLYTFGFLMPLVGTAALIGRFVARKRSGMGFEMDDYLCIPAWMMTLACGAIVMTGTGQKILGQGVDQNHITSRQEQGRKLGLIFDIMQAIGLATIKFSAIFLYRRLFPGRGFNLACSFVAGFTVQWFLTFIISVIVFGVRRLQHPEMDGQQFSANNSYVDGLLLVLSVENILVNVALFILPIVFLLQLHLPVDRALKITAVFLFAAVAIFFGIMQLAMPLTRVPADSTALELVTGIVGGDDLAAFSVYVLWGMLQLGCLLLAVCLPAFGPIVHRISKRASQAPAVRESRKNIIGYHGHNNSPADEPYPKALESNIPYPPLADMIRHQRRVSDLSVAQKQHPTHNRRPSAALSSHPTPHSRNTSDVSAHFRMPSASSQTHGRRPSEISLHIRQASVNGGSGSPSYPTPVHIQPDSTAARSYAMPPTTAHGVDSLSNNLPPANQAPSTNMTARQVAEHIRNGSNSSITGYRTPGHKPQHAQNLSGGNIAIAAMMVRPAPVRNPSSTGQLHAHTRKGSGVVSHSRKLSAPSAYGAYRGEYVFGEWSPSNDSSGAPTTGSLADLDPRQATVSSHVAGATDPSRTSWLQSQRSPLPWGQIKVKHGFTQSVEERDVGNSIYTVSRAGEGWRFSGAM